MKTSYFVTGIFLAIALARFEPSIGNTGGILHPEITVKYISIIIIFLSSGLTLPTEDLTDAILQWDLHLYIQLFTFVGFPAIIQVLVYLLKYSYLHPALLEGMTILSTMPPPVSSAIIITKAVGGNEAAAVFNSAFGSMAGIFVTPALIILLLNSDDVYVPTQKIFQHLFMTVVVPLFIGQIFRNMYYTWLMRQRIPFKTIGHVVILFIIYTTFCTTFSAEEIKLDTLSLITTIVLMFLTLTGMQLLLFLTSQFIFNYQPGDAIAIMYVASHKNLLLVFILQLIVLAFHLRATSSSWFNFTCKDSIALAYCATHKSLTLGIPVIDIIFEGNPNISFLSIPLLIYNPMQIVIGGMSIPLFRNWLENKKNRRKKSDFHWSHV